MPAVAAAGVKLAYIVLGIGAGSIVLLLGYLLAMDVIIGQNVHDAYAQIVGRHKISSEAGMLLDLGSLAADLAKIRDDPSFKLDSPRQVNDQKLIGTIQLLPALTQEQKSNLGRCAMAPSSPSIERAQLAEQCVSLIQSLQADILQAAGGVTDLQSASDMVAKLLDSRQSVHAFWLQAAQLILLNLLLPVLTALLGYIFGTQQERAANAAAQS
jgi:hypothetical protein